MSKPQVTFRWADESRIHPVTRAYLAHNLRCYRRNTGTFLFTRAAPGVYYAALKYPGSPLGIYTVA
jgi:hypothetical protein